ncbi:MAG: M20/M25/M40 family metallo-hydrolase, partial [Novosphingobium sp.]
ARPRDRAGGPRDFAALKALAAKPDFVPRLLDLAVTLEATTRETRINTHNVIGRLPGRRPDSGAVLLLAHWDHFGECAAPPAEDLICNGAIDNASGLAALTEIARRLAKGPALDRDVYFLATTAEEIGLLGAEAFAEDPPLPLSQIVAAFNIDSFALAPRGAPLGIVGRGLTPLDAGILAVAKAQKRKVVEGDAANAYIRRQDGWALLQHDVPTVMVSSSWSDIARVERFFETDYHRPGDQLKPGLDLSGTAEDVAFHVALVRHFGDPKKVPLRSK